MYDIWSVLRWWDDWQLRILVLGSLGLQWFLLLAVPLRKYAIPRVFRTCIWLAYISSDALAIYALATLFNRHGRTSNCGGNIGTGTGSKQQYSSILEVLWAPILLLHLGRQDEMSGYEIEDKELWTRHIVTFVSQVAVALYAFCKSWPSSSDWKLLAAAILLFVISFVVGVVSFSQKLLALNRAKRLAAMSACLQGTKKPSKWRERMNQLLEESSCYTGMPQTYSTGGEEGSNLPKSVALTEADKVLMVLSDMSLLAVAKDLVARKKAGNVEEVLPPLPVTAKALRRWLRGIFAFIFTKDAVVVTRLYLLYHLLVVAILHIAALTLFATSDKHPYKRADVKITYIILCLTAALDVLTVFRQQPYRLMSMTKVPALYETVASYNLIDAALLEGDESIGWIYKCARRMGFNCFCRPELGELNRKVAQVVITDLVDSRDRDLASYRIFDYTDGRERLGSSTSNWALSKELQEHCGDEIKKNLRISFDRSVLLWHIATDLCNRCCIDDDGGEGGEGGGPEEGVAEEEVEEEFFFCSSFEGGGEEPEQEQQEDPEQQEGEGGGSQEGVAVEEEFFFCSSFEGGGEESEARRGSLPLCKKQEDPALRLNRDCTVAISSYMAHLLNFKPEMLLTGSRHYLISEAMREVKSSSLSKDKDSQELKELIVRIVRDSEHKPSANGHDDTSQVFHIIEACKLAKELLEMPDHMRWRLMYRVWLGMLCYSASMCRGYQHEKSLGEGGEFLSFVWLVLAFKGAKSLADKLQMPSET